jgi:hypothetical protein
LHPCLLLRCKYSVLCPGYTALDVERDKGGHLRRDSEALYNHISQCHLRIGVRSLGSVRSMLLVYCSRNTRLSG